MREDIMFDNQTKPCKCSAYNQNAAKVADGKSNGSILKPKFSSSWGSQIVRGFTTDKKTKMQTSKKPPLACSENSNQNNQHIPHHSRVKRSLIGDFPSSANAAQVHPNVFDCHHTRSPASHDLVLELDHLRRLLRESKERELALQSELLQHKENPKVLDLERELDTKRTEIDELARRATLLEAEKINLSEQLDNLSSIVKHREGNQRVDNAERNESSCTSLEVEVVELRRLNKELQLQKRNLAFRLSSAESRLAGLAKDSESDIVAKVEAEASLLRHTNANLSKQVEGLQMSRLTEVEELAYLRWINSCLRHELCNADKASRQTPCLDDDISSTGEDTETDAHDIPSEICNSKKPVLNSESEAILDREWFPVQDETSPRRRHSISGTKECVEDLSYIKRRQSDHFICYKEKENETSSYVNRCTVRDKHQLLAEKYDLGGAQSSKLVAGKTETCKASTIDVEKRALRIPNPPPRPSTSVPQNAKLNGLAPNPPPLPPPPPPPPPKFSTRSAGVMQRAPQVAELYHSLMKRDSRKDSCGGGTCEVPNVANVRSSMIGEIENRSSHLMAIKADVETQGEFVKSLIKEVNDAAYRDIEDVLAFVKWLDDELCFLVDERAVLKHFDWPEKKADTLREAAFGYRDLKKLESEVSNYEDDPRLPCDVALKKMVSLSEKMERSVYNLVRTRDVMLRNCKEFKIPTDWMLDSGIISKIKFASVKLAKNYMKRVASELQSTGASNKDPALEYMLLQGVRFAFRIHQFAGGFDAETMRAFEELRNLAHDRNKP
ncbi:protein CHUP1, chloroplastic-like [Typha angustifolia]|uniref:protein CHUP1, chloroplastic-like n=1 Tax=Typha angustifolia TaxID=59011 RepID=UPI003C2B1AED